MGKNRIPDGWNVSKSGDNRNFAAVTAIRDQATGGNVVKVSIPKEASVHVDTVRRTELDPQKEYLLIVQFKITNMHYTGNWYRRPAGVRIYVHGTNGRHRWLAVNGEGSTDGWVTAILPFLRKKGKKDRTDAVDLSRPDVFLRCYNMAGTVYFRNPMIIEKPAGVEAAGCFEMEDGRQTFGRILTLKRTKR